MRHMIVTLSEIISLTSQSIQLCAAIFLHFNAFLFSLNMYSYAGWYERQLNCMLELELEIWRIARKTVRERKIYKRDWTIEGREFLKEWVNSKMMDNLGKHVHDWREDADVNVESKKNTPTTITWMKKNFSHRLFDSSVCHTRVGCFVWTYERKPTHTVASYWGSSESRRGRETTKKSASTRVKELIDRLPVESPMSLWRGERKRSECKKIDALVFSPGLFLPAQFFVSFSSWRFFLLSLSLSFVAFHLSWLE